MMPTERELHELFALNVLLQLFDGIVTWQGLRLGFEEANPILSAAFPVIGPANALLLFKANSCGLLVLLRRSVPVALGFRALRGVAIVYAVCSVAPWLATLLVHALLHA